MNIGIDIRPLMSPVRSGVGEYTLELLTAIFAADKTNQYFLFYNSHTDVEQYVRHWHQDNIAYVYKKWPNKLFNLVTKFFNTPKIDRAICHYEKVAHNTRQNNSITSNTTTSQKKIYDNSFKIDYFFSPNPGFTALSKKTKHILTIHDLSFEFFPEFFSLKQRIWHWAVNPKKQCQQAAVIICPSENTKRDIISLYKIPAEKIKVIYPGISTHRGATIIPAKAGIQTPESIIKKYNLPSKFILFLGTIEPRKNILSIIEAFEKSYSSLSDPYSLVLAGYAGWKNKQIYQKISSSPLRDKIHCIGAIDEADKPVLYTLASLFVCPSFYEGFGFPPLEAMACGTPVITSNRSSLPEVTGNAAYLVNPNRPTELAEATKEMLTNKTLREHFIHAGLKQAKKTSWAEAAKNFIDLLP